MRARAQLNTINQTNPVEAVNYQNSPYFVDQNNRRNQRNHQQPIPNDRYPSGDNQQRNRFENAYSSSNILNENILNPNPPSTNDISASQMSRVNIDGTSGIN
ncbi:hypothetical protein MHBO_002318 [Bonamia ostreae]|uniref:Uncharacterized protein n=1 Tax=Bonamia ostreae TaxID=126728 RepID=A0ABV2AMI8_9EUKA